MTDLLTIGDFAHRCGLSRSALRFYDDHGLLAPARVDDDSGYRYYAPAQLTDAALIRRLREAEMPLQTLRRYLDAALDERRAILEDHLASFQRRAEVVERAAIGLRRELDREPRWCAVAAATFVGAVEGIRFAVGDSGDRPELAVVWVQTRAGSLRLVATDSYRLAVRDIVPGAIGAEAIRGAIDLRLWPVRSERAGATGETGELTLAQDAAGTMIATLGGRPAPIGHAGDGFPDYERILTELPPGNELEVPRDAVAGAIATLPPDAPSLALELGAGGLELEAGGARTSVAGRWPAGPLRLHLDRGFFADAIDAMVGPDLVLRASGSLDPVAVRSADTGTCTVLTMPIRPPDPR